MSHLAEVLKQNESSILEKWINLQTRSIGRRSDLINEADLKSESSQFLSRVTEAARSGNTENIDGSDWKPARDFLDTLSRSRAIAGFSPSETATFVFSLKQPLFQTIGAGINDTEELREMLWNASNLIDKLGLYTVESFQKTREAVISRQQEEMLELSTPVVKLWDGVLALPLIGTLDSARTQVVMENLLQRIVETGSEVAIIDITGVPHVDTLVAQHLLKTITAAKLMGAECIISGIRPQIAQTIVHLGVNLGDITTKASLADAFQVALRRTGRAVASVKQFTGRQMGTGETSNPTRPGPAATAHGNA